MTAGKTYTVDRVLVAFDTCARNYDALEIAAEFAALLEAHLTALFVEDINLLKLAELPFAKELDRSSGVMRPLHTANVIRALQSDARRLEQRLGEESQKRRISASMQVIRGHYVAAAKELAHETDIVVISHTSGAFGGAAERLSMKSRLSTAGVKRRPIWVFYDGSEPARRGLELAAGLGGRDGSELVVVLNEDSKGDRLHQDVQEALSEQPRTSYQELRLSDPNAISGVLQARGCAVLILPRETDLEGENAIAIDQIKGPRILV